MSGVAVLAVATAATPAAGADLADDPAPGTVPAVIPPEGDPQLVDDPTEVSCAEPPASAAERIEHNQALAEVFFIYYRDLVEPDRGHHFWTTLEGDCLADDMTIVGGVFQPPGIVAVPAAGHLRSLMACTPEVPDPEAAWLQSVYPGGWGAEPGTLTVVPFDGGVYYRFVNRGVREYGEVDRRWEVGLALVDDDGRVSHWEFWVDELATRTVLEYATDGEAGPGLTTDEAASWWWEESTGWAVEHWPCEYHRRDG
ncbi:MAG: hypothetical protein S0880_05800 [Actinomycetota bacterium]|nr:hypothetical protein [Actinomycetota bacterium]